MTQADPLPDENFVSASRNLARCTRICEHTSHTSSGHLHRSSRCRPRSSSGGDCISRGCGMQFTVSEDGATRRGLRRPPELVASQGTYSIARRCRIEHRVTVVCFKQGKW